MFSETLLRELLYWIMLLAGIPLIVLAVVGTLTAVFAAMFQISDQVFNFSIKIIVLLVLLFIEAVVIWGRFCNWVSALIGTL